MQQSGTAWRPWAVVAAILAFQAAALYAMGQPVICECGTVRLWNGVVASAENSQQISDWYSFSHIIHGILFYAVLHLLAPGIPVLWRLAIALGIEVSWEILENSPIIINRYRQSALAAGYSGDSILNSLFDSLFAAFGFLLASRLKPWQSVAFVVAAELFVGTMIRDNLTLNIIQLAHPSEALSRWQGRN